MEQSITFRELDKHEIGMAMELAWEVFMQFEAPEYSDEGINEFYRSIHDDDYVSRLRVFGALSGNELVGMIATRNEGTHIALFFVKGSRHRQGIGRMLFQTVMKNRPSGKMTVNSSPYAVPVYQRFGFTDTDIEQVVSGLRFTPMELK